MNPVNQTLSAVQIRCSTFTPCRSHRGFTLVECLVYVAVFGIIASLALAAFYRAREANRDLRRCAEDIVRAMQAGERQRAAASIRLARRGGVARAAHHRDE